VAHSQADGVLEGEYVQTRSASNNYRSGMSKHVNNLIAYYMQEMLVGTKLDNV